MSTPPPIHNPDDDATHLPDDLPDAGENFGLDAAPGTKGVKATGIGLDADGNATGVPGNDPDTYRDAPRSGAKTGGGGL